MARKATASRRLCTHRWIEKNYKGQVCVHCRSERGHFLPGKKRPQWFKRCNDIQGET